ncbi:MAG: hypothetical protein EAZ62_09425, partial [Sphingobacteriia bacterium]
MPLPFFHRRLASPFTQWVWAIVALLGSVFLFEACGGSADRPDISQDKLKLKVQRFEQDFFALDTLQLSASLEQLKKKYPRFAQDFLYNILGTVPAEEAIDLPRFIQLYQPVKHQADSLLPSLDSAAGVVEQGLKYFHHYVPQQVLPQQLISFVGPMNGYGAVITPDAIG